MMDKLFGELCVRISHEELTEVKSDARASGVPAVL